MDYGLIDADGRLTEEPICYRDNRTDGVMEQVFASVPREEIYRRTGIQFHQLNTLYQLAAHVREGLPREAARLLLIPDLCHHLLCGSQLSERSDASTTQLLSVETGDWDDELFDRLGLPRHLMPAIVTTGTDLGPLAPDPVVARRPGRHAGPGVPHARHGERGRGDAAGAGMGLHLVGNLVAGRRGARRTPADP